MPVVGQGHLGAITMATLPLCPGSSSKPPTSCHCPVLPSHPAMTRGPLQRALSGLSPPPPAPALSVQTSSAASTKPGRPTPAPHQATAAPSPSHRMSLQAKKLSPLPARIGELCARINYRKLGVACVSVCAQVRVPAHMWICASVPRASCVCICACACTHACVHVHRCECT